eukprot:TRINITY_DN49538_c0_g1_i1.p1 TRINITY_DN49538_c0_g1~~TRINITY_DN49538_c0_g1_i1.p1  ORF type:complete len:216 (-),score=30.78 TRINITY_DN49538_c0_g1_i1:33-626(-)
MLASLNAWMARHAVVTAALAGTSKTSGCDFCVQRFAERRDTVDWRRNAAFASFGLSWVGCGQYFLFNKVFPFLVPGINGRARLLPIISVTMMDSFVHIPFLYLPIFYLFRAIAHEPLKGPQEVLEVAVLSWRTNLLSDVRMQCSIFAPVIAFNFAVNPPHLRVPFTVAAGILWVCVLSFSRGAQDEGEKDVEQISET